MYNTLKSGFFAILNRVLIALVLTSFIAKKLAAQELPMPTHGNTFFMMPLFPELQTTVINDMGIRYEMDKMAKQMGEGNLYHQMGVACTYKNASLGDRTCRLAKEKGMRVGMIFELQTHIDNNYFPFPTLNQDIRAYQWRLNGIDWYYSSESGTGSVLYPGQTRDSGVFTPSRLCTLARNNILQDVATTSSDVLALMKKYPGVISINNAIIEEELATGGQNYDNYLGDYSPYAITEFRDWLRHAGIYDDVTGTYKGEGAQAPIVGTLLNMSGALRSQFYDDPTPADANGTGVSFNTYFGTSFTTWATMYYDLVAYPNPIPFPVSGIVTDFNPTPQSGTGFTSGGFDAPRVRNVNNNFWNAWSWDVLDHGGAYPVGHPTNPAFGFRQQMVKNYIKDIFKAYADAGFPTENMYPHQIPGEIISAGRLRSGGDPLWTGYLPVSNNTGITRFGYIDPSMLTQYSPSWGIFEWHPIPNSKPTNQILHDSAFSNLNTYYKNGAHALFPGWWHPVYDNDTTFPLADSKFADGIKDFMSPRKEQPYTRQDSTVPSYTPPQVLNVEVLPLDANTHLVRWPQEIWANFPETWRMWSQLESFDVEQSTDSVTWTSLGTSQGLSIIAANRVAGTTYYYHVRASAKSALKGNWSSAVTLFTKLSLTPDSSVVSALDSSFVNNISIKSTANINTYATGGAFARVDNIGASFQESFTNNNQAEYPADIRMTLNGAVTRNVGNQLLVKFTPPSGATIDAVTFNYFANYDSSIVTLQVLDDANQLIWENNAKDTSNGYKGVHFPNTSTSFTFCLTMKQTSSIGAGWFAQVSGIKVIYTNTPYQTGNLITAQVTGVGIALNTVPSNYAQANMLYTFDASSDVFSTNQLTGMTYNNGLFAATTNGTDPYAIFNLNQNINGQANPYIYARIYCSQAITNAQLYWYKDTYYNSSFNLNQGWNVVQLSNLPDWINSTSISTFRMDFGNVSGISFKVDWIAISPQAYTDSLVSVLALKNGVATLPTACTGAVGNYTVVTNIGGIINSTVITVTNIQATTNTQAPFTPGNLVVARIGDGSTATITGSSTYFPIALQEYTTAGGLVQTIPLASASSGSQLTVTGNNQEVSLNLSANKAYLSLLGYDAGPTNNTTATTSFSKVIGRVGVDGVIDYSTKMPADAGAVRQVTSADGSNFWYATSSTGVKYLPYGNNSSTASTNISNAVGATNVKAVDIFNNQLYGMGFNGVTPSLYNIGTNLPTTTATNALLAGLPTGSSSTNNGFVFFDTDNNGTPDLLYTIDGLNLRKYTYSATSINYISGFTVAAAGSGYTSVPTISFTGGGGSGLAATAVTTSNAVSAIYSTVSGSGYTSAPTVSFTGGGGSGATATATLTSAAGWVYNGSVGIGVVSAITVGVGGAGYTTAPTVSFSGGGGSGAAATATISGGAVTGFTITNCGSGYTAAPTITFNNTGTGGSGATATAVLPGNLAVGITGTLVSSKAQLYITFVQSTGTTGTSNNALLSIADGNGSGAAPSTTTTILAKSGSNYIYRGVAFAPNPNFATWTGTTSTNWNTGTNWLSGTVPGTAVSIIIPPVASGNYPVLPSTLTTGGITVQFGASLSTNTSTAVTGNITVSSGGTFTIGNATTITGNVTSSGTITVNAATTITGAFTVSSGSTTSINANTTVNGNVIFPSTSTIAIASGMALTTQGNVGATIAGDGTNAGTFTGAGKVVMNSSAIRTFGCSFNNLDLNPSSSSDSMSGTPTINGFLNLITGQLNCGTATLTFGTGASAQFGPKTSIWIPTSGATIAFNGRPVTFKSDATGTAQLGYIIAGSISGATNVTVERYITAKSARKFSFIGSPVTSSFRNAWQQQIYVTGAGIGGVPCGTTTGDGGSTDKYNSNGFDATLNNAPTIYKYNATLVNGSRYVGIANTEQTNLSPGTGYVVNVRGNRNSSNVTCFNQLETGTPTPPEAVTLSATGTVTTGDLTVALNDPAVHRFTLLANSYPCQISFSAFHTDNSNINNNMWTYSPFGSNNYTTYSNGVIANGATGYDNTSGNYIASGEAFFVQANTAGSVTFHETHKTSGTIPNTKYFGNVVNPLIRVGLRSTVDNSLLDEIVVRYNSNGSNSYLPNWDASSLSSGSQTLASLKDTERLAIATHAEVTNVDTTNLAIKSSAVGTYKLFFSDYQDLDNSQSITLADKFLNTTQDIRANQVYDFNVTSDTASEGNNRFAILVGGSSALPVNFTGIAATIVGDVVNVKWSIANEANIASYEVERSTNGTSFNTITTKKAVGVSSYTVEDANIPSNANMLYYRIKSIGTDGTIKYSSIAKLTTNNSPLTTIVLYPNPLVGKKLNVSLSNVNAGKYVVSIYNVLGQKVVEQTISHDGSAAIHTISFNNTLAAGVYNVSIIEAKSKQLIRQINISVQP